MSQTKRAPKPSSLTSIAFGTGVVVEREAIADFIEKIAAEWQKPVSLNHRAELQRLATRIRQGDHRAEG